MKRPPLPYSIQMAAALLGKNEEAAGRIVADALGSISGGLVDVANSYDRVDLPFVIVSLKLVAEALSGALNESGKAIVDRLLDQTTCIGIDANALREAMGNGRTEE